MDLAPARELLNILETRILSIKARDKREPLRKQKAATEDKITRLFSRQFRVMIQRVLSWAETLPRETKATVDIPDWLLEWEDEFEAALVRVLVGAVTDSGWAWLSQSAIQFDSTGFNSRAYRAAKQVVGDMIKGISDTTKEAVREAVQNFISTPGMTIGDLTDLLSDTFGPRRAETIAVTETTNAFAAGEIQAGLELKEKFPDVPVTKTWMTNEDERVCPICGGLDGQEVDIDEPFVFEGVEYDAPAVHPNDRCWISIRTRISGRNQD